MSFPSCRHLCDREHRQPRLDQHRRIQRLPHGGPGASVPDYPRAGADLHPAAAAPRVGDHAVLHRHGHHLPHGHLRPAGDVPLAPGGHALRPLDRLHRDGSVLHGGADFSHRLLHQRGRRSALQAPQQHRGGLLLRALCALHIFYHCGTAVRRQSLLTGLKPQTLFSLRTPEETLPRNRTGTDLIPRGSRCGENFKKT